MARALRWCRRSCPAATSSAMSTKPQARIAAEVPLPPGYRIVWGGQFENQQRAAARLSLVLPMALALIFACWCHLRRAAPGGADPADDPLCAGRRHPRAMGAGEYLSVPASVGFIALLGIAVLNGLVHGQLYPAAARAAACRWAQAVDQGARRRLRPVLMTAASPPSGWCRCCSPPGRGRKSRGRWRSSSSAGWSARRC